MTFKERSLAPLLEWRRWGMLPVRIEIFCLKSICTNMCCTFGGPQRMSCMTYASQLCKMYNMYLRQNVTMFSWERMAHTCFWSLWTYKRWRTNTHMFKTNSDDGWKVLCFFSIINKGKHHQRKYQTWNVTDVSLSLNKTRKILEYLCTDSLIHRRMWFRNHVAEKSPVREKRLRPGSSSHDHKIIQPLVHPVSLQEWGGVLNVYF